jgi:hypothetical protein
LLLVEEINAFLLLSGLAVITRSCEKHCAETQAMAFLGFHQKAYHTSRSFSRLVPRGESGLGYLGMRFKEQSSWRAE